MNKINNLLLVGCSTLAMSLLFILFNYIYLSSMFLLLAGAFILYALYLLNEKS